MEAVINPKEISLAFGFYVYQDHKLAERLISQITTFYPQADILCIADGEFNNDFAIYAEQNKVSFLQSSENLKTVLGGLWLQQLFVFYLKKSKAEILIKLDPDTFIWRPFNYLPDSAYFGHIKKNKHNINFASGGCYGINRLSVKALIDSNYLHDPKFRNKNDYAYQRYYSPFILPNESMSCTYLMKEDWIMAGALNLLDIQPKQFGEVWCEQRKQITNTDLKYAVTHPIY